MLPMNDIDVCHHHSTQTIWPKYDISCNNLQAKKCQSEFDGITVINHLRFKWQIIVKYVIPVPFQCYLTVIAMICMPLYVTLHLPYPHL